MAPRRPTAPPATASPAVTRSRKRAAFKSLSKPRLTLRSSEVSETSTYDRSALSTLAAAAAVVIVISSSSSSSSSSSLPSSERLRRSISSDGSETQKFFHSVQASHDETQSSDVIHSYYQMHSKTSSVKEIDLNISSDSEISSLTSSVSQSVQKSKKK
jgi:hypothetical protein